MYSAVAANITPMTVMVAIATVDMEISTCMACLGASTGSETDSDCFDAAGLTPRSWAIFERAFAQSDCAFALMICMDVNDAGGCFLGLGIPNQEVTPTMMVSRII